MKRRSQRLPWFWTGNQSLSAVIATVMPCSQCGFATALVELVSGNAIVFGADGKSVDTRTNRAGGTPVATGIFEKIVNFKNQIFISTTGIGRIQGSYDFNAWVNSLPVKNDAGVEDVARIIQKKCKPIFEREWKYQLSHGNAPISNLSGDESLPWVSYYVGGNEFMGPRIYFVAIYVNWAKKQLKNPTVELLYPPNKGGTTTKHIFVRRNSSDGGGMDKLFTPNSEVQRKYLKLYNRDVGAALYDEPLDVDSMIKLARILLTVEIETNPDKFSFPITVCSSVPSHRPSCNSYDY